MSNQELLARIAALEAQNAQLTKRATAKIKFVRSDKSEAVILAGLRQFPISLYESEWATVFGLKAAYEEFLNHNPISDAERERLRALKAQERALKAQESASQPKATPFNGMPSTLLRKAIG